MDELYILIAILVIGIIATNPWLLVVAGIFVVCIIIYFIKNPEELHSSGGSSTAFTVSDSTSDESSDDSSSNSSDVSAFLYSGTYVGGTVTGTYRDGRIFEGYNSGLSMSFIKASYQNGFVYDSTITSYLGTVLGRYENGYIYKGNSTFSSDIIGRYENGYIYKGNSTWSSDVIGRYTGNDDGGAATAIIFLFD